MHEAKSKLSTNTEVKSSGGTDEELLRMALEALENAVPEHEGVGWWKKHNKAKQALRDRLAEIEAEAKPTYWYARAEDGTYVVGYGDKEIAWGLAGETARQVVEVLNRRSRAK